LPCPSLCDPLAGQPLGNRPAPPLVPRVLATCAPCERRGGASGASLALGGAGGDGCERPQSTLRHAPEQRSVRPNAGPTGPTRGGQRGLQRRRGPRETGGGGGEALGLPRATPNHRHAASVATPERRPTTASERPTNAAHCAARAHRAGTRPDTTRGGAPTSGHARRRPRGGGVGGAPPAAKPASERPQEGLRSRRGRHRPPPPLHGRGRMPRAADRDIAGLQPGRSGAAGAPPRRRLEHAVAVRTGSVLQNGPRMADTESTQR
jgi:hypothetical protein